MSNKESQNPVFARSFTLAEFTASAIASQLKLDNTPDAEAIKNLRWLAIHVLQPLRDHFQKAVKITSGYRSETVNIKAGGVPDSDHRALHNIAAADIIIKDVSIEAIAKAIYELELPVEQVIVEYDQNVVHVSARRAKNEFLTRRLVAGKIIYAPHDPTQKSPRTKGGPRVA